ncbi:MAG: aggregation factor core [Silicimonas sp.]|nr:aggregation factor core [Silicimonas sp.]
MRTSRVTAALCVLATQSAADIGVQFIEGAPKDRFVLSSTTCPTGPLRVTFDLRPSAGALIFDVTESGAGVEVFQPFELVAGEAQVAREPAVRDGDQVLSLALTGLAPGSDVSFTIDLDDTVATRSITVAGSELVGAKVFLEAGSLRSEATFNASANLAIPWTACTS